MSGESAFGILLNRRNLTSQPTAGLAPHIGIACARAGIVGKLFASLRVRVCFGIIIASIAGMTALIIALACILHGGNTIRIIPIIQVARPLMIVQVLAAALYAVAACIDIGIVNRIRTMLAQELAGIALVIAILQRRPAMGAFTLAIRMGEALAGRGIPDVGCAKLYLAGVALMVNFIPVRSCTQVLMRALVGAAIYLALAIRAAQVVIRLLFIAIIAGMRRAGPSPLPVLTVGAVRCYALAICIQEMTRSRYIAAAALVCAILIYPAMRQFRITEVALMVFRISPITFMRFTLICIGKVMRAYIATHAALAGFGIAKITVVMRRTVVHAALRLALAGSGIPNVRIHAQLHFAYRAFMHSILRDHLRMLASIVAHLALASRTIIYVVSKRIAAYRARMHSGSFIIGTLPVLAVGTLRYLAPAIFIQPMVSIIVSAASAYMHVR